MGVEMRPTFAVPVLAAALALAAGDAAGDTTLFEVTASIGDATLEARVFGWQDGATDAIDAFDVAEPPAPPQPRFTAALAMSGAGIPPPNRWRADIRSPQCIADGRESWILVLESAPPGSACALTFAPRDPGAGAYTLEVSTPGSRGTIPVTGAFGLALPAGTATVTITVQVGGVPPVPRSWSAVRALFRQPG